MAIRLRRARSLVLAFEGPSVYAHNFVQHGRTLLDDVSLLILTLTSHWVLLSDLLAYLSQWYPATTASAYIDTLVATQAVVLEGTEGASTDASFDNRFEWGLTAGLFHFSIKNAPYMSPEQMSEYLVTRVASKPTIPLFTTNERYSKIIELPPPSSTGIFDVMRRRRSYRGFASSAIDLSELTDCLFSGFGITHFVGTLTPGEGRLPLSMTPSAGARNPYEAYVCVNRVKDLSPGAYHYSALDNTLGLVSDAELPSIGALLANQPWFDNAAATIVLVANFERTMWKYPHPTGYRVVLIEAGHIAQNISLAATALGLASAPTCAVSEDLLEVLFGLDSIVSSPVYTVSLGNKSAQQTNADTIELEPNPFLSRIEQ